jgi:ABC-type dipeptide/oligopeptide/nickel transport system permease subunit
MAVAVVAGVILGTLSAVSHNTWRDAGLSTLALLGVSFPVFWTGLLFIWLFGVTLRWLPVSGQGSLRHLVMPAATLGWYAGGILTRLTRSGMLEVLRQDYVTTARAKGLAESSVLTRHALRNALIPVITVATLQFGGLLGGAVVVETVFARDGMAAPRNGSTRVVTVSPLRVVLRRLGPGGRVSLAFFALLIVVIMFPQRIAPYSPTIMAPDEILSPPSAGHWFGTDQFGRDILSRLMYGTRVSLSLGIVAVLISLVLSLPTGLAAGYYRGRADAIIMRIADVMLAFPGILLAMMVIAILGPGLINAMIAVGVGQAPAYARVVRASTLVVREQTYLEAAQAIGSGDGRILARHVLPNVIQPLIVVTTVGFAAAIIIGSSLGFLGLGALPPTPEWGTMVSEGRTYFRSQWWISVFPGMVIGLAVLTFNILGDTLRDILDPRLRK